MNAIVTTTINPPTEALLIHASRSDWDLIVVGDLVTPHQKYDEINCIYLHPDKQDDLAPELSANLGWRQSRDET